jgi:hypothetical protein
MSEEQGYYLNPDHPANRGRPNAADETHYRQAAHREAMLPCSGSAGQPLADKEPVTPRTEVERLSRDIDVGQLGVQGKSTEDARELLALRKLLSLPCVAAGYGSDFSAALGRPLPESLAGRTGEAL